MRIVRLFHQRRAAWILGLASVWGLAAGCGESGTVPAGPTDVKSQQDAERAAREKAFGVNKTGGPSAKGPTKK